MKKTMPMAMAAITIANCATTQPPAKNETTTPSVHQPVKSKAEWDLCAEQAINKEERECEAQGKAYGECFGAMGASLRAKSVEICGWQPAPADLTSEMKNLLDASCQDKGFESNYFALPELYTFDPDSQFMKDFAARCNSIREKAVAKNAAIEAAAQAKREARAAEITIRLGSPEKDVYDKFGRPSDINTSVGPWGVHKQLVYGKSLFIYIENGRVSAWQN